MTKEEVDKLYQDFENYRSQHCYHCAGNGCDDCRDCDVAEKKWKLELAWSKAKSEFDKEQRQKNILEFDKQHKVKSDIEKLDEALPKISDLINKKFKDKKDNGGCPYINHLTTVATNASETAAWDDGTIYIEKACYIVGLCHDLFEDTDISIDDFREILDDDNIIAAIKLCTHVPYESYSSFIKTIKESNNKIAIYVKIADLENNMDIRRLTELTDYNLKRLHKYFYSWRYLNGQITWDEYKVILKRNKCLYD